MISINDKGAKKYDKEYNLYSYYHYYKNKIVGVVYGWYMKDYLFIDIVYVKKEYRKKGIATCILENVIKEMKENKKVDVIDKYDVDSLNSFQML